MWYCGLSVVFHILALQANQRHQINHLSLCLLYCAHGRERCIPSHVRPHEALLTDNNGTTRPMCHVSSVSLCLTHIWLWGRMRACGAMWLRKRRAFRANIVWLLSPGVLSVILSFWMWLLHWPSCSPVSPQYFEVPFDSNMNRTKNRPLVRGQIRYSFTLFHPYVLFWFMK